MPADPRFLGPADGGFLPTPDFVALGSGRQIPTDSPLLGSRWHIPADPCFSRWRLGPRANVRCSRRSPQREAPLIAFCVPRQGASSCSRWPCPSLHLRRPLRLVHGVGSSRDPTCVARVLPAWGESPALPSLVHPRGSTLLFPRACSRAAACARFPAAKQVVQIAADACPCGLAPCVSGAVQ